MLKIGKYILIHSQRGGGGWFNKKCIKDELVSLLKWELPGYKQAKNKNKPPHPLANPRWKRWLFTLVRKNTLLMVRCTLFFVLHYMSVPSTVFSDEHVSRLWFLWLFCDHYRVKKKMVLVVAQHSGGWSHRRTTIEQKEHGAFGDISSIQRVTLRIFIIDLYNNIMTFGMPFENRDSLGSISLKVYFLAQVNRVRNVSDMCTFWTLQRCLGKKWLAQWKQLFTNTRTHTQSQTCCSLGRPWFTAEKPCPGIQNSRSCSPSIHMRLSQQRFSTWAADAGSAKTDF